MLLRGGHDDGTAGGVGGCAVPLRLPARISARAELVGAVGRAWKRSPECADCAPLVTTPGCGVASQALQIGAQIGGVLIAQLHVFLEALVDDVLEFGGHTADSAAPAAPAARFKMASKVSTELFPLKAWRPVAIS